MTFGSCRRKWQILFPLAEKVFKKATATPIASNGSALTSIMLPAIAKAELYGVLWFVRLFLKLTLKFNILIETADLQNRIAERQSKDENAEPYSRATKQGRPMKIWKGRPINLL